MNIHYGLDAVTLVFLSVLLRVAQDSHDPKVLCVFHIALLQCDVICIFLSLSSLSLYLHLFFCFFLSSFLSSLCVFYSLSTVLSLLFNHEGSVADAQSLTAYLVQLKHIPHTHTQSPQHNHLL